MQTKVMFCKAETPVSKKSGNKYGVLTVILGGDPVKMFVDEQIATKAMGYPKNTERSIEFDLCGSFDCNVKVVVTDIK